MSYIMTEEDKKWRRRSDARTLAEAETIKADKKRYAEAKIGANELLSERKQETQGLEKIAGKRVNKAVVNGAEVFPNLMR